MKERVEKRGSTEEKLYDLLILNVNDGENEHSPAAVSHIIGSNAVNIHSNVRSWGAIPVEGRENIQHLRDALIRVCQEMGIE